MKKANWKTILVLMIVMVDGIILNACSVDKGLLLDLKIKSIQKSPNPPPDSIRAIFPRPGSNLQYDEILQGVYEENRGSFIFNICFEHIIEVDEYNFSLEKLFLNDQLLIEKEMWRKDDNMVLVCYPVEPLPGNYLVSLTYQDNIDSEPEKYEWVFSIIEE
jgi:hypothetical protein